MKQIIFLAALTGFFIFTPAALRAQTNAAAPAANTADREKATLEKHIKPVLAALKLSDADKAAKVHDIVAGQFQALKVWHAQNDAAIKALWNEFNQARSKMNVTNADAALAKLVKATVLPAEVPSVRLVTSSVPAVSGTVRVAPSLLVSEPAQRMPPLTVVLPV